RIAFYVNAPIVANLGIPLLKQNNCATKEIFRLIDQYFSNNSLYHLGLLLWVRPPSATPKKRTGDE
ncbi:MAG: hypothetical protein AB1633_09195, partial [Elusimicrobiota bacterium]